MDVVRDLAVILAYLPGPPLNAFQELSLVVLEGGILFEPVIVLACWLSCKAGRVVNGVCSVVVVNVLTEGGSLFRRLVSLVFLRLKSLHIVLWERDLDLGLSHWLLLVLI